MNSYVERISSPVIYVCWFSPPAPHSSGSSPFSFRSLFPTCLPPSLVTDLFESKNKDLFYPSFYFLFVIFVGCPGCRCVLDGGWLQWRGHLHLPPTFWKGGGRTPPAGHPRLGPLWKGGYEIMDNHAKWSVGKLSIKVKILKGKINKRPKGKYKIYLNMVLENTKPVCP